MESREYTVESTVHLHENNMEMQYTFADAKINSLTRTSPHSHVTAL